MTTEKLPLLDYKGVPDSSSYEFHVDTTDTVTIPRAVLQGLYHAAGAGDDMLAWDQANTLKPFVFQALGLELSWDYWSDDAVPDPFISTDEDED